MTRVRRIGLLLVLLSTGFAVCLGCRLGWLIPGGPIDFQAIYYGSQTLIQGHNPYQASEVDGVYRAMSGKDPAETARDSQRLTLFVNLPPTLLFVAPFAKLSLATSQVIWVIVTAGSLILAAVLISDLGADHAPVLSVFLIVFLLANCLFVFAAGNTAGIVIDLCVVAVWCFLKDRFVPAGVICMAICLAVKPHDVGLVWLYFLLAGGTYRKRASLSAILSAALALPAFLWVSHVAPHWMADWQANMLTIAAPGGLNDPRLASVNTTSAANVISLQAVFSIFRDDPKFYNVASYLVCSVPLLVWVLATLLSRFSRERGWLALAAIVPLTMLITYHRVYDAKLLLLTIPACGILWARRGPIGWAAMVLGTAGVVLNADVPLAIIEVLTKKLYLTAATLSGKIFLVVLTRPNQEILLAMSIFYLWVYVRSTLRNVDQELEDETLSRSIYASVGSN